NERLRHLVTIVTAETAEVLGHANANRIDPRRGFFDLGLDSLMAVELRRRLQQKTGIKLPSTLAFDHPNPAAVATFVLGKLALHEAVPQSPLKMDLEQLEGALSALYSDESLREELTKRMQAMV